MKKIITIMITMMVAFTVMPMLSGIESDAMSKPGKPKGVYANNIKKKSVTINWSAPNRGADGYVLYKNGKKIRTVVNPYGPCKVKVKKLKTGKKYKFYVKAFFNSGGKRLFGKKSKTIVVRPAAAKSNPKKMTAAERKIYNSLRIYEGYGFGIDNCKSYVCIKPKAAEYFEVLYKKPGTKKWHLTPYTQCYSHVDNNGKHIAWVYFDVRKDGDFIFTLRACKGNIKGPCTTTLRIEKYQSNYVIDKRIEAREADENARTARFDVLRVYKTAEFLSNYRETEQKQIRDILDAAFKYNGMLVFYNGDGKEYTLENAPDGCKSRYRTDEEWNRKVEEVKAAIAQIKTDAELTAEGQ